MQVPAHIHMCTHPHLCKPKNQLGMVNGEEEKPFYWYVV